MKPLEKHREVATSGVTDSTSFGISMNDAAHIMTILRDTLYSDKILAVLREYSANAWDSHRMSGKADVPIKVRLPSWTNPTLIIQDFGKGLSHEDVFQVYTQYGASTKRNDNSAVGMLGIGSKSAFAYSDTFTIVSCHGGVKRIYVAHLDESDKGVINLQHEEPCGEETGVTIKIACRQEDVQEFQRKAAQLYRHFIPRPDINIPLPAELEAHAKLKNGIIYTNKDEGWIAVMGCVPYRLNFDQLKDSEGKSRVSSDIINRVGGTLFFNIGDVQVNASREELKYSQSTKDAIVQKFEDLVDEFVTQVLDEIEHQCSDGWSKRTRSKILIKLGVTISDKYKTLASEKIHFPPPETFQLSQRGYEGSGSTSLNVAAETRILFRDDVTRSLKGYSLGWSDYLLVPLEGKTLDDAKTAFEEFCKENDIEGIPTANLSSLEWKQPISYAPPPRAYRDPNPKHRAKMFVLAKDYPRDKPSDAWEIVERIPKKGDVFILINSFKYPYFSIFDKRSEDRRIAELLGSSLPKLYGYKTSKRHPVDASKITGIEYREWRKKWLTKLLKTQKALDIINAHAWAHVIDHNETRHFGKKELDVVISKLGEDHPVSIFCSKVLKHRQDYDYYLDSLIRELRALAMIQYPEPQAMKSDIINRYPLLQYLGIDTLFKYHRNDVLQYVKTVDLCWVDFTKAK